MVRARLAAVLAPTVVVAALVAGCGTEPEPSSSGVAAGQATGVVTSPGRTGQVSTPEPGSPPTAPAEQPTSGQSSQPAPSQQQAPDQIVRLSYGNGQISGDTGRVEVPLGSTVALVVTGATADEVHVHGYDLSLEVPAKRSARLVFTADVPGVFEVELHDAGKTLTRLAVS